jgi:hypothetical protein
MPPVDPKYGAPPKAKIPPSDATSQYAGVGDEAAAGGALDVTAAVTAARSGSAATRTARDSRRINF